MYSIHDMHGFSQYHLSLSLEPAGDPFQLPYESTPYPVSYFKWHFNIILPFIPRFFNRYLLSKVSN